MINLKISKKTELTKLEEEIDRVLDRMSGIDPETEDYDKMSEQYVKLTKLHLETNSKKRVSPDALANAASSLAGILLILNYEHAHAMTSKAVNFVGKKIIS